MSALLALLSSLIWGTSDYLGGITARRMHVAQLLLIGQSSAVLVLLVVTTATGSWVDADAIGWGIGAGVVGPIALSAFYTALSQGTMGVVAPVASCGVLVPVVAGLARGERPTTVQAVGIVVTVTGIVLAARAADQAGGAGGAGTAGGAGAAPVAGSRRSVGLAVVAAAGFGAVLLLVAEGSRSSPLTTLTTQRLVNVTLVATVAAVIRPTLVWQRRTVLLAVGCGLGDVGANATYAFASRAALVSVTAVLASLYSVVTALLARRIDGERLSSAQAAGVATTLAGVIMLAAG